MTQNKRLVNVLIFFVILPFILAQTNTYLADSKHVEFSFDNRWMTAIIMYALSFFGSVYILRKSSGMEQEKLWSLIGLIGIVIFGLLFYLTYSFSNFGF